MNPSARVTSIDAVREWKDALAVFQEKAREALVSLDLEIRRAFDWLEDQRRYWQQEVRKWDEKVEEAKRELWRRKNMPIINNLDYIEQEKALRKAQQRLAEAEVRLEKTRKWQVTLRREVDEYQGQGTRLAATLEGEMPRALTLLEQKIAALEAYLAVAPPSTTPPAANATGLAPATAGANATGLARSTEEKKT